MIIEQEDKELLFKDLFARLPHGVMCQIDEHGKNYKLKGINKHKGIWWYEFDGFRIIKLPKPYLRPMSSMTEDERKQLKNALPCSMSFTYTTSEELIIYIDTEYDSDHDFEIFVDVEDWLTAHHFDYRGLIEKGLAIEVTEENNPYKN